MKEERKFSFGKNWKNYLEKKYTPRNLEKAEKYLNLFLKDYQLEGKTFLDVGCGSGIHSLAALKLGAKKVVSIDVDDDSIKCCDSLQRKIGEDRNWQVSKISLLDDREIEKLGKFDCVYCWGVAHHTGDMWHALDNLVKLVAEDGFLVVAIYNKVEGKFGSKTWHYIKKFYVNSSSIIKKLMECIYIGLSFLKLVLHFKNPFKIIRKYKEKRGMDWKVDLIDWLGGYLYEYASVEEIFNFYQNKYNMKLINIKTTNYIGNNQFLFKK